MIDPKISGIKHANWLASGIKSSIYDDIDHAIRENKKLVELYKKNGTSETYIIFVQAIINRLTTKYLDK